MAVTATENIASRTYSAESAETLWTIRGTTSEATAIATLALAAPTTFNGMLPGTLRVKETDRNDVWIGTVPYKPAGKKPKEPATTGDDGFSLRTTGGRQHITNSIATTASYAAAGTAPDYKNLIGVTDKSVDGVDVVVPSFTFSQKYYVSNVNFTSAFILTLFNQTGTMNNAVWTAYFRNASIEFPTGTVLFLGAEINERGDDVEVVQQFTATQDQTGLSVGEISAIAKNGQDYLWIHYETKEDGIAKRLVKQPTAVYVEQVYQESDFDELTPPGF